MPITAKKTWEERREELLESGANVWSNDYGGEIYANSQSHKRMSKRANKEEEAIIHKYQAKTGRSFKTGKVWLKSLNETLEPEFFIMSFKISFKRLEAKKQKALMEAAKYTGEMIRVNVEKAELPASTKVAEPASTSGVSNGKAVEKPKRKRRTPEQIQADKLADEARKEAIKVEKAEKKAKKSAENRKKAKEEKQAKSASEPTEPKAQAQTILSVDQDRRPSADSDEEDDDDEEVVIIYDAPEGGTVSRPLKGRAIHQRLLRAFISLSPGQDVSDWNWYYVLVNYKVECEALIEAARLADEDEGLALSRVIEALVKAREQCSGNFKNYQFSYSVAADLPLNAGTNADDHLLSDVIHKMEQLKLH